MEGLISLKKPWVVFREKAFLEAMRMKEVEYESPDPREWTPESSVYVSLFHGKAKWGENKQGARCNPQKGSVPDANPNSLDSKMMRKQVSVVSPSLQYCEIAAQADCHAVQCLF